MLDEFAELIGVAGPGLLNPGSRNGSFGRGLRGGVGTLGQPDQNVCVPPCR